LTPKDGHEKYTANDSDAKEKTMTNADQIFTPASLDEIFPPSITDAFFEALFGDAEDGAYDIRLRFEGQSPEELRFAFHLMQRPGMCLACNLTYGLPQVFTRHPLLGVGKLAQSLADRVNASMASWALGSTREVSRSLHVIPFIIKVA
jgi:hypothetical protein